MSSPDTCQKPVTDRARHCFQRQLMPWAEAQGLCLVDEMTASMLSKFRGTWSNAGNRANTARRKHQRLSGFLWFCVRNDWLEKNPAKSLKAIRVKQVPTDYFTRDEFARIVDATYAYGDWQGGPDFHPRDTRPRALILLIRLSG